jgi:predicted metal-binding membrane protein
MLEVTPLPQGGAMNAEVAIPAAFRRERLLLAAGLALLTLLAWAWIVELRWGMDAMAHAMPLPAMAPMWKPWSAGEFLLTFAMWAVMMVAMMVPSTAPMILLFATVHRRQRETGHAAVPTAVFLAGYLAVWSAFSLAAALTQWGLHAAALLSPMMVSTSPLLGGALLLAAGVYQWTPLKGACLAKCRSPLGFLLTEWRDGARGAVVMGIRHGAYCAGCCWALMALLFVGGVMNLLWVAAIAAFVLVEKAAPAGGWLGRIAGLVLVTWGGWMAVAAAH